LPRLIIDSPSEKVGFFFQKEKAGAKRSSGKRLRSSKKLQ
jgi:hypothetical protein